MWDKGLQTHSLIMQLLIPLLDLRYPGLAFTSAPRCQFDIDSPAFQFGLV